MSKSKAPERLVGGGYVNFPLILSPPQVLGPWVWGKLGHRILLQMLVWSPGAGQSLAASGHPDQEGEGAILLLGALAPVGRHEGVVPRPQG